MLAGGHDGSTAARLPLRRTGAGTPQPELDMLRGGMEVLVGGQEHQVVAPAELDEKRVHGADLYPSATTSVADLGRFDVVLPIGLN
jgi:hypothetical protein